MPVDAQESAAVLSKSRTLINKLSESLHELDHLLFPTADSKKGRDLLLSALRELARPGNIEVVSPSALYSRLFAFQKLVEIVEESATSRISRPLVLYCDIFWRRFFEVNPDGPILFYSLTHEHNYMILNFSKYLGKVLSDILPDEEVKRVVRSDRRIYCLQLASSEGENSPLYANIGHEFGHAVYDSRAEMLIGILKESFRHVLPEIREDLKADDSSRVRPRLSRFAKVLEQIAQECFCDLIGSLLMGPAFFLSLYEISWAQNKASWRIRLSPNDLAIRAYPSFNFRLHCAYKAANVEAFCGKASEAFRKALPGGMERMLECLSNVPLRHDSDIVIVQPAMDADVDVFREIISRRMGSFKAALNDYVDRAAQLIEDLFGMSTKRSTVDADEVAQLILRLHHKIPPNIIPDGTLLGRPATFEGILNASALLRFSMLVDGKSSDLPNGISPGKDDNIEDLEIVERLTAKAFEVTLVQRNFNKMRVNNERS